MLPQAVSRWFVAENDVHSQSETIDWLRIVPFVGLHLACFAVLWVGVSAPAVIAMVAMYVLRMFAITAFFHRYFSHKAFKTSRVMQFIFALIGTTATQRGPLWWAAHHRAHHHHADTLEDPHHSARGFWWSHMGWFLCKKNYATDESRIRDFAGYPELVWLTRFDIVPPVLLAASMFALGELLSGFYPATDGWQMLVWGYFISTVVLIHATLLINSLAHRFGKRDFQTRDASRNSLLLALLTLGEGWHNNHHRYAGSARQGFFWWQVDVSYYVLRLFESLGLVWDLRPVPATIVAEARQPVGAGR